VAKIDYNRLTASVRDALRAEPALRQRKLLILGNRGKAASIKDAPASADIRLGRGGSIGFADPDARIGFGYVTNQYVTGTAKHPDRRVLSLVDAVYGAL